MYHLLSSDPVIMLHTLASMSAQELASIQAELNRLRVQACRKRKRDEAYGLPPRQKLVVVAAYVLSDYDLFLAEAVGSMLQRQAAYPAKVPVPDWFRTIPWKAAKAIHEPLSPADRSIRSEALKWITEVRTTYWVRDENFNREVAPASDSVALQYVKQMRTLDEGDRARNLDAVASQRTKSAKRTVRKWSARFRQKWKASLNKLGVRDGVRGAALDARAGSSAASGISSDPWSTMDP